MTSSHHLSFNMTRRYQLLHGPFVLAFFSRFAFDSYHLRLSPLTQRIGGSCRVAHKTTPLHVHCSLLYRTVERIRTLSLSSFPYLPHRCCIPPLSASVSLPFKPRSFRDGPATANEKLIAAPLKLHVEANENRGRAVAKSCRGRVPRVP